MLIIITSSAIPVRIALIRLARLFIHHRDQKREVIKRIKTSENTDTF